MKGTGDGSTAESTSAHVKTDDRLAASQISCSDCSVVEPFFATVKQQRKNCALHQAVAPVTQPFSLLLLYLVL